MGFHLRTFFLLFVLAVSAVYGLKICELRDVRVFCQCDGYETDKVRTVTCNFLSNVTGDDEIWSGFQEQRMVESLSLNGRGEGSVTSVPSRVFMMTRQLHDVMFTGNRLGILRPKSFVNMDRLVRLDLEQNEITGLQEHTFANLPNLTTLVLSVNAIKVLPSGALHHVPSLRELFLDRNDLEVIADHAFQHLHGLLELDLNSNKLSHISSKTFVGLGALRRLDLSRNSLVSLKDRIFRSSASLMDLDLSRNRITEITPHAFDGLKHLQKLNLKDNKLFNLQKTVFKGAPHLIQINLADNKLITLQKHILDPLVNTSNSEFVIFLKGNSFECRCEMLWISAFVNNSKTHSESLGLKKELRAMKCTFGDQRTSAPFAVMDLRRDEMVCPDPPIARPPAPVYHAPPQHHKPHHQTTPQPSTSTTTTTTEEPIPDEEEPRRVQTPDVNRVELPEDDDDQELTTVRAPIVRATVKAKGKIEAKNIELSDAAESTGAEPKAKTDRKKADDTSGDSRGPKLDVFLLVFVALLQVCFKILSA